ncbi:uncharacterized protein METZ01_LOCUS229525 [marine metagenome]|uniref:Uncharacterized protein n=1 Tax=marine metagenome TaxID=408172 RepID=A0A382GR75_9ZZZZ
MLYQKARQTVFWYNIGLLLANVIILIG